MAQQEITSVPDKLKIKSGLVYRKHTGELVGFCDLGKVNLGTSCTTCNWHGTCWHLWFGQHWNHICMHVIHGCIALSGTKLYVPVWEVTEILSSAASDGASLNHQFPIMQNYAESIIRCIRYQIYTLIVISIPSVILHICWKQLEIVSAIQELIQRVTIWW